MLESKVSKKKLKIWNGRAYAVPYPRRPEWPGMSFSPHIFICALSKIDAARICEDYFGFPPSYAEMRDYWSPCWGNSMEGIIPERGLWIQFEGFEPPVRVVSRGNA